MQPATGVRWRKCPPASQQLRLEGLRADAGSSESAYFSVNGTNVWQNDFRLDGINDNIEFYGGNYTLTNAAIVPPPDAVQEFTLQSGDFNAEFGHSTGGVVNAAIKSGTNSLHGDLWEYVRNNDLNANYYFNNANGVAKPIPEYHQNLFGVTAGGPVLIPHVLNGKDKTFWFFDYQGGRYVLPEPAGGETVPTTEHGQQRLYQSSGQHYLQQRFGDRCPGTHISARHNSRPGHHAPASCHRR